MGMKTEIVVRWKLDSDVPNLLRGTASSFLRESMKLARNQLREYVALRPLGVGNRSRSVECGHGRPSSYRPCMLIHGRIYRRFLFLALLDDRSLPIQRTAQHKVPHSLLPLNGSKTGYYLHVLQ